ncbi:MAG TPA: DUF362 domain-containing protein [Planctomycetota bacterium]|mgnify:CR=1 FL=1|nr:DUF362 domain-containing protein [Planctomycetota bacterium]HRR81501.1 DUF362 domain-containing protein [Planctomycetota bacterium]HRT92953.1 DUF362 domain-containing protein [Planctomycetota bacterium]
MDEHHGLNRREFLAVGAGAVAALAARPGLAAPDPRIVVARGAAKMPADEGAYTRLKAALDKLGGFKELVSGKKALLKINGTDKSFQDANTSAAMTAAVIRACKENGAKTVKVIGQEWDGYDCKRADGPTLREVIKAAGAELEELIHWWLPTKQYENKVPTTGGWKELWVAKEIFEPDAVLLNIPRLKTHAFTIYTGCVKNCIGLTWHMYAHHCTNDRDPKAGASDQHPARIKGWEMFPGKLAGAYHEVYRKAVKLNILDAGEMVYGWGGPKPERIRPVAANAVIVGTDALAVDAYGCQLLHEQEPKLIPTALADWTQGDSIYVKSNATKGNYLAECQKLGAGQGDLAKIKIDEVKID